MPKPTSNVNSKAAAGRARKADSAAAKQAELDRKAEAAEAAAWQQGANARKSARDEAAAAKADDAARKKKEKEMLLAAEEDQVGATKVKKSSSGAAAKKKKPMNDLALLEDSLQKAADKSVKKKKADELAKQRALQAKEQEKKDETPIDPLLANTETMIGGAEDVGRGANKARMESEGVSGIDAALESLNIKVPGGSQAVSAKALYKEFEDRMLPIVKEENPGLRLSQYKDRIWALWKKSPENPANQVAVAEP